MGPFEGSGPSSWRPLLVQRARVSSRFPCTSTGRVYVSVEATGEPMTDGSLDLPQGTLDLLILKALSLAPLHGWGVSARIRQISRDKLDIQQGSMYPSLHRLERRGWIKAKWGVTENNRRAKYYELTRRGREQLEAESDAWAQLVAAVGLVLKTS